MLVRFNHHIFRLGTMGIPRISRSWSNWLLVTSILQCSPIIDENRKITNMNSDSDADKDSDSGPSVAKKSKSSGKTPRRKQKYRSVWETIPEYQKWLSKDDTSNVKAKCKVCRVTFVSDLSSVKKHNKSEQHMKNMQSISTKSQSSMHSFIARATTESSTEKLSRTAELKLAGFFAEHNIPFRAMDHLQSVLKSSFPDSKIAGGIQMKRTKCTAIVKNVIAKSHKDRLAKQLRTEKFSILTDESTDFGSVKTSCVVVRFFDINTHRITSKFWNLCDIFESGDFNIANQGATGENLFRKVMASLEEYDIPIDNIIGFASDGCNAMMGAHNSVMTRFKEQCPGITVLKCVCHSLHLCASEACKNLPRRCEDFARNVHNFFGASAKRIAQLQEFQAFFNIPVHKILHPSQTRWLSLHAVVMRIIEQWDALRLYFDSKYLEERLIAAEEIRRCLHDPFMKLFYHFLVWILPKFSGINQYFQSSKVVITDLHAKMQSSYKDLLLCYMNRSYVNQTKLSEIDPNNFDKFLPDTSMYLGVEVTRSLQNPEIACQKHLLTDFYQRCRQLLQKGCQELKKRYNFDDALLPLLALLTPQKAISNQERETSPSLVPLILQLPRIVSAADNDYIQHIDDEWRKLPITDIPENIKKCVEADEFWAQLLELQDLSGDLPFNGLSRFALAALSLPHSNADCERVFSKVNLIKVKNRNRLNTSSVNGCMLASQCMQNDGSSCEKFVPTDDMLKLMSKDTLYGRPSKSVLTENPENNEDDADVDSFSFDE